MLLMAGILVIACGSQEQTAPDNGLDSSATTPRRVQGIVLLDNSSSHSGIHVFLGGTSHSIWTDSRGNYVFDAVELGQYELIAEKEGFAGVIQLVEVPEGASDAPVELPTLVLMPLRRDEPTTATLAAATPSLQPGAPSASPAPMPVTGSARINGRVILRDAEGRLSSNFPAITAVIEELNLRSPLGPDGSFVFDSLPGRALTVSAIGQGYQLEAPVAPDLSRSPQATVILRMQAVPPPTPPVIPPGALSGAIVLPESGPDARTISVSLAGTGYSGITDQAGEFMLENIPAGDYDLVVEAEGYEAISVPAIVEPGEIADLGEIGLEVTLDPPRVLETNPANGARGVMVRSRTQLTIRFSKPMDRDSVKRALTIEPRVSYRSYMGNEHPRSNDRTLMVELMGEVPTLPVLFGQRYRVMVSDQAEDEDGLPMESPFEMTFTTAGPALVDWEPKDGAIDVGVDLNRSVRFRLNDRLAPDTDLSRYVRIRPRIEPQPRLQATYDTATGWTEIRIFSIWEAEETYRVTLDRGLKNVNGARFENLPQTITFRTAPLVPIVPLRVDDLRDIPSRGQRGIERQR